MTWTPYNLTLDRLLSMLGTAPSTPGGWAALDMGLRTVAGRTAKDSSDGSRRVGRELGKLIGLVGREGGWIYNASTGQPFNQGWWSTLKRLGLRMEFDPVRGRSRWNDASFALLMAWADEAHAHHVAACAAIRPEYERTTP